MIDQVRSLHSHALHSILVIDDDQAITEMVEELLRAGGYANVVITNDARRALPLFREVRPDLVLLDLHMPHLDGLYILKALRDQGPPGEYLPILVLTGDDQPDIKRKALLNGASEFLTKPVDRHEIELRVRNLLQTRDLHLDLANDLKRAEIEIARRLAAAAELRDYGGEEHTQRVGRVSALLAGTMGLPQQRVDAIRHAAPLHDIGKIAIPDSVLLKPESLTLEELELVKQHTTIGARALSGSGSSILQLAEEIALYHHENWDGTGYTPGLARASIPLEGRIVSVADSLDALVHDRPYKRAWPEHEAIEFIREQSGAKFDPDVVEALVVLHASGDLARAQLPDEESVKLFPFPLPYL